MNDMPENVINNNVTHNQNKRSHTTRMRAGKFEDIPRINAIAAAYLGAETLDNSVIASWLSANNEILRVIECDHNPHTNIREWHLCGYYILLPLINSTMELVKKDTIIHADIPPSAIQPYSNPLVTSLFLMDLMAHEPICAKKYCGRMSATHLFYDFFCTIQNIPERYPHIKEIITITTTKEAKILIQNLKFLRDYSYSNPHEWELWSIETAKLAHTAKIFTQKMANKHLFSELAGN